MFWIVKNSQHYRTQSTELHITLTFLSYIFYSTTELSYKIELDW